MTLPDTATPEAVFAEIAAHARKALTDAMQFDAAKNVHPFVSEPAALGLFIALCNETEARVKLEERFATLETSHRALLEHLGQSDAEPEEADDGHQN